MEWSEGLKDKLRLLATAQQRAVVTIIEAEAAGVPLSRLLRTTYSCRWCGRVIGRSGDYGDDRKGALLKHQDERGPDGQYLCDRQGQRWRFVCAHSTYYRRWRRSNYFNEALALAREESIEAALTEASRILRLGSGEAAGELRRQVNDVDVHDKDRRLASVAILDRADLTTARKVDDGLAGWLLELRDVGKDVKDE